MISTLYDIFKPWSDRGSVYLLSDTHFDDDDCKLMDPKWILPKQQVERINNTVKPGDTWICLGDVGNPIYIDRLKSKHKILLLGNHDRRPDYIGLFDEIYSGPLFISDKIFCPFCHISFLFNVAANVCDYTPVNLGQLIKKGILSGIESIHRETINRASGKYNR